MNYIKIYIIALVLFLLVDAIWLLFISKKLYQKELKHLIAEKPNLIAALIFYLIFLIGLVYFIINPNIINESPIKMLFSSGLFGLVTYATYDLTNLATLKNWPIKITIIDLIWGVILSSFVSLGTYYLYFLI